MASATDIITYIGVPLAVVGVLPILYTFVLAIFTRRRIQAVLVHHGHKPLTSTRHHDGFTIRSSPMTSLLEVELPRYTIAPFDRSSDEYWRPTGDGEEQDEESQRLLNRAESTLSMVEEGRVRGYLRGGSWRAFNWKKLIVGKKLYRLQYEDELREPAAEIDFSDLVHYLLDWGAVPDAMGWEQLKSGGLWTPAGTVLLRKAGRGDNTPKAHMDWVLRTTMPDESDGVLSLTIRWSKDAQAISDLRGAASLPPGWGRLKQPALLDSPDSERSSEAGQNLPARIEALKLTSKYARDSTSFRFVASDNRIHQAHWETSNMCTGSLTQPFLDPEHTASATWFTSAAAACLLIQRPPASHLWGFNLPPHLAAFSRKDSMPCGILVLLGILAEDATPQWSLSSSDTDALASASASNAAQRHHQRFLARREAERLEATMPPDQARVHRANREAEFHRQQRADISEKMAELRQRDERRVADAIASPRLSPVRVAEACLAWLARRGEVGAEWDVRQLAEAVLYLMVLDGRGFEKKGEGDEEEKNEGRIVVQVLEEWMDWNAAGGMKRQHFLFLEQRKLEFCFAASIIAVIHMAEATGQRKANVDMMECLRLWRTVRLG
ncbi:uncharacterized protein HMPREF1541_01563 [Cyphellophora europaea CBS 101466]|uniref:Uncharacterized protein n=1 Tax=Cyphellophora europaea (strain CBS 101466) TaxID=1220924 RepID=W2S3A6_CYPE1|nr:uncharacterized protein HMPREF1541_01563 [Cyphellophora europaea CBS 101466]ETN42409.1 hypothetical protein HMPREF1541_01563 [Cyphellophora europaea CBS 101466]